ncbi:helix-turn-helix domain-containing protein [Pleurocapsales cyanobacterium LEGE 10410]|nr:helix-turn-helix domain-containing protein [Pleurocapsales cyanobacterium LEGE 10410]
MAINKGITKQELAKQYGISWRTVYRTLKTCGLNTAKQRYSKDEELLFKFARSLFDGGFSKLQVADYINQFKTQKPITNYE